MEVHQAEKKSVMETWWSALSFYNYAHTVTVIRHNVYWIQKQYWAVTIPNAAANKGGKCFHAYSCTASYSSNSKIVQGINSCLRSWASSRSIVVFGFHIWPALVSACTILSSMLGISKVESQQENTSLNWSLGMSAINRYPWNTKQHKFIRLLF